MRPALLKRIDEEADRQGVSRSLLVEEYLEAAMRSDKHAEEESFDSRRNETDSVE